MKVIDLELSGLKLIQPTVFADERGFFLETYSEPRYRAAGIEVRFQQDNHSRSAKGTLRGLHYQSKPGQAKLIRVATGRIWDVAVDIRPDSSTFGRWHGLELNDQERQQLFVPVGFAHGFCVLSEFADVQYKVSTPYDAATECGIAYSDPDLNVQWPVASPILSARDQQAESFASFRARVRS
ncbi:MAG TPA: dTDP-4-dehydrorhamnose 3,5-epimerase [Polyangiaceae bacterium]|jgi:dTDP-4-dehydrorhamnose 3,5-epimerase